MFPKSRNSKRDTGRSGLVRSALEKLSLFSPTFPVRQKHGAGSFAVCGQRLRGHVPSKNTSPAALSWSSLTNPTTSFLSVPARYTLLSAFVGTRRAVSADFNKEKFRWKRSAGTFPKLRNSKRDTGRSGLVRSALEKLSLFSPTFSVCPEAWARGFRRLRTAT